MKGRTLLIDGYNLGLEKGTGVATYARNLSYEIANLGHRVSVVYGNEPGDVAQSADAGNRLFRQRRKGAQSGRGLDGKAPANAFPAGRSG